MFGLRIVFGLVLGLLIVRPAYALPSACTTQDDYYLFSALTRDEIQSPDFRTRLQDEGVSPRDVGFFISSAAGETWELPANSANRAIFSDGTRTSLSSSGIHIDGELTDDVSKVNNYLLDLMVSNSSLPNRVLRDPFSQGTKSFIEYERYSGIIADCNWYNILAEPRRATELGPKYRVYILRGGKLLDPFSGIADSSSRTTELSAEPPAELTPLKLAEKAVNAPPSREGGAQQAFELPACGSDRNGYLFSTFSKTAIERQDFSKNFLPVNPPSTRQAGGYLLAASIKDQWQEGRDQENYRLFGDNRVPHTILELNGIYLQKDGINYGEWGIEQIHSTNNPQTITDYIMSYILSYDDLPQRIHEDFRRGRRFKDPRTYRYQQLERYEGIVLSCGEYNRAVAGKEFDLRNGKFFLLVVNGGNVYEIDDFEQTKADDAIDSLYVDVSKYMENVEIQIAPSIKSISDTFSCHIDGRKVRLARSLTNFEIIAAEIDSGNLDLRIPLIDIRQWESGKPYGGNRILDSAPTVISDMLAALGACVTENAATIMPMLNSSMFVCADCAADEVHSQELLRVAALYIAKAERLGQMYGVSFDQSYIHYFLDSGLPIDGARRLVAEAGITSTDLGFALETDGSPRGIDIRRVLNAKLAQNCKLTDFIVGRVSRSNDYAPIFALEMRAVGGQCIMQSLGATGYYSFGRVSVDACDVEVAGTFLCTFDARFSLRTEPPMPFFANALANLPMLNLKWRFRKSGNAWNGEHISD